MSEELESAVAEETPIEEEKQEQPVEEVVEDSAEEQDEPRKDEIPELTDEQIEQILSSRKFKTKVDGEEVEVDFETMRNDYQRAAASNKRFQEASGLKKQAEEFLEMLRKDPRKVLSHPDIGIDPKQFAEDVLADYLEEQALSPEQKELRELKRWKAEQEAKKQEEEAEKAKSLEDQQAMEWAQEFNSNAPEALKSRGIPVNNVTMRLMRDYAIECLDNGYEPPISELAKLAKEDYQVIVREVFSSSQDEILADLVGEDNLKRLRNIDLGRVKNPKADAEVPVKAKKASKGKKSADEFESLDEYFEYLHSTL